MPAVPRIPLTPEKAWLKALRYCAFQERSQQEVRDKLYSWGLHRRETEELISRLISENFLKEERFAEAFAGGKFRIKKWGRNKIRQALKIKQVSEPLIRQALAAIPEKEYRVTLRKVLEERSAKVKEAHPLKRRHQIAAYAVSRGFEPELVWELLGEEE
jgi:regulatory protein